MGPITGAGVGVTAGWQKDSRGASVCLGGAWTMLPEQEEEGAESVILTFGPMGPYEKLIETVALL